MTLELSPRFTDGDAFYEAVVEALDAAGDEGGQRLLARLVLILANQVGDQATLMAALEVAKAGEASP